MAAPFFTYALDGFMIANAFRSSFCRVIITFCLTASLECGLVAGVIDFEDLTLPSDNSAIAEPFTSAGAQFPGSLQFDCCWEGWILGIPRRRSRR